MLEFGQRKKVYLIVGLVLLINFLAFQNFESSFDIQKTRTDFSMAIDQAEKDADRTTNKMEFSSEAEKPAVNSLSQGQVQLSDQPVQIRLKRAPAKVKKKNRSYVAAKLNSKKKSSFAAKKSLKSKNADRDKSKIKKSNKKIKKTAVKKKKRSTASESGAEAVDPGSFTDQSPEVNGTELNGSSPDQVDAN